MFKRVILEHQSRDPDHVVVLGMVASEPVLVELDNAACMKLAGDGSLPDPHALIDHNYAEIATAVERLYDEEAFDPADGDTGIPRIVVTALDLG